jgi:hypothetical protein
MVGGFVVGTGYRPVNAQAETSAAGGAAPAAGAPTVPSEPVRLYDFENGSVAGWHSKNSARFVDIQKVPAKEGTKALQARLYRNTMSNPGYVQVKPPANVARGSKMIAQVLVPYGSQTGLHAKAFVQDANWGWTDGGRAAIAPGKWTELMIIVPDSAPMPLQMMGVQFEAASTWSGRVYIDDVRISP